jgi:hypothetical protein
MKDWTKIRERYLKDAVPVRLGGLATNLGRIRSFAKNESNREVTAGLVDESKHFIEWTATEADIEVAAELIELQVKLARWQYRWNELWSQPQQRVNISNESKRWSDRILQLSGLLD